MRLSVDSAISTASTDFFLPRKTGVIIPGYITISLRGIRAYCSLMLTYYTCMED